MAGEADLCDGFHRSGRELEKFSLRFLSGCVSLIVDCVATPVDWDGDLLRSVDMPEEKA